MKTDRHKQSVRKQAGEASKPGEAYYRLLFEHSADAILLTAPDGSIFSANPAACRMFQRTEAEICSIGRNGLIDPDDPRLPAALEERERTGRFKGELTHLRSDGQKFPCEISSVVFTDQDGQLRTSVIIHDISERKALEEAIKQTNAYNGNLIETSLDPLVTIGPDGRITDVNAATELVTGCSRKELIGTNFSDYFSDPGKAKVGYKTVFAKGSVRDFELEIRHRDGYVTPVIYNASLYKDASGKVIGVFAAARDVTELKLMEKALRKSEERINVIADNVPALVAYIDREGYYRFVNARYKDWFGVPSTAIIGKHYKDVLGKTVSKKIGAYVEAVLSGRHVSFEEDLRYSRGGERWVHAEYVPDIADDGAVRGFFGLVTDITERKRAEEALKNSEEKYRSIFENTIEGIFQSTVDGRFLTVNPAFARMHDYESPDEMIKCITDIEKQLYADPAMRDEFTRNLYEHGAIFNFEHKQFRKDGSKIWVRINAREVRDDDNNILYYEGTAEDITKRKQVEETLFLIMKAVESASDAIGISDPQGHHFYQNKSFTNLFEYTAKELEDAGGGTVAFSNSDTACEVFDSILNGRSWSGETEMISKSGRRFPVFLRADSIKDDAGKIISVLGTFTDITERKQMEENLRESEEQFRLLADQSMLAIGIIQDGVFKYFNKALEDINGYSADEIKRWKPFEFSSTFHPDDVDFVMEQIRKKQSGHPDVIAHYFFRIMRKNGDIRWIEIYSRTVTYKNRPADMMTLIDITERKDAEKALGESEERYKTITEKTIAGIYLIQDGLFRYVNPTFCNIHGYTRDELVDKLSPLDLVVEEEKEFLNDKILQRLSGEKEHGQFSIRIRRKDGEVRFLEVFSSHALYIGNPAVLETCIDVTEARKANEAIKRSQKELRSLTAYLQNIREEERIRIAREIHDELGQSLTGIKIDISWLKKKLSNIVEPKDPIQTKIDSLLTLTESTIATTRELSLSLRPGILDDLGLAAAINWLLKRFQEKTGIICMFQSDVAEIAIPTGYSTALFRISQECLTNVSRHADATKVKIAFIREGENLVLEIDDNGKGIKTEQIRNPLSLGILGMRERIIGLKGRFNIKGAPGIGTKVRVELPIK